MSKVMVGSPVRNRGWVIPRHLDALLEQTEVEKEFCYIVNDCTDDTISVLENYGINYINHDLNQTNGWVRGQYSYGNLAILRNSLLDQFLKSDCEYLFSIDTDIIIQPGSLKKLLDNNKDVVSMVLNNCPFMMAHNLMIDGNHLDVIPYGLIPCDLTGAVYLIHKKVVEAGARYSYTKIGEDKGFCDSAKALGFSIYCDTRIQAIHAYDKNLDLLPIVKEVIV